MSLRAKLAIQKEKSMEDTKTEGKQESQEKLYSVTEGKAFLKEVLGKHIASSTLYDAIYKGNQIGAIQDGHGQWRISEERLLAYATEKYGYSALS